MSRVAASVLVVEDDPEILRLMQQVLSRDFVVHTAADAEEALQVLSTERVQAVVSDHMLPTMSGVELLRIVATQHPEAARVLVTASTRMDTAQEAVNVARVRRFLAKPFRANELLSTVGEAIHEVAVAQIKSELVRELKERNSELGGALAQLGARDKDLSKKIENLALNDNVTGLFTHRYFQEALSAELARARVARTTLALVMVDIDRFRDWNHEYSYAEGDVVLRRLGEALVGAEAASRYGGDVLAALLPRADAAQARVWAENVCRTARELGRERELAGRFTVRCGVALFPLHAADEQALIDAAERAVAAAKAQGGDRVVVGSPAAHEAAARDSG
jgi:diguanylate cyclase (GGDEF)-like protein